MKITVQSRSAFEKWLHENHLSYRAAGRLFGVSGEYVRQIASGEKLPGDALGKRILAALLTHPIPAKTPVTSALRHSGAGGGDTAAEAPAGEASAVSPHSKRAA